MSQSPIFGVQDTRTKLWLCGVRPRSKPYWGEEKLVKYTLPATCKEYIKKYSGSLDMSHAIVREQPVSNYVQPVLNFT